MECKKTFGNSFYFFPIGGNQGYGGYSQPSIHSYPPQGGYPAQGDYPPQGGYPPPGGYPPQEGYPPQGGFSPQEGYPPQVGYPTPGGYPQQGGYFPIGGYPPPQGYPQPEFQGPPAPGFVNPNHPDENQGYVLPPDSGDAEGDNRFSFDNKSVRMAFIRKVYGILVVQLGITFGFVALFLIHKPTQKFVKDHPIIWWVALVVLLVTLISMSCCSSVRRKSPMNLIFLALFTCAEAFMLAMVASKYESTEVLLALGITAAVCLALTLFAFQTKWDFTKLGGILLVGLVVLLLFGIIAIFIPGKIITLAYASFGALLFSFYLVYDTQLMMGGKHKYSISPEEYIFAALNLYLDVINIFTYILMIIGVSRD
ncbi:protein lifeguard 2-like [Arctopsyche grandis]|uniref:protein lifeguard 2-like n=1 Tax=Arctopsyche grandis TaxID=121162 RepID=UPI00406D92FD